MYFGKRLPFGLREKYAKMEPLDSSKQIIRHGRSGNFAFLTWTWLVVFLPNAKWLGAETDAIDPDWTKSYELIPLQ